MQLTVEGRVEQSAVLKVVGELSKMRTLGVAMHVVGNGNRRVIAEEGFGAQMH